MMFEGLKAHKPADEDLDKLALIMSGRAKYPDVKFFAWLKKFLSAPGKSIVDVFFPEPVLIPAGYTYLAQFIAHDISFDQKSNRHDKSDRPWNIKEPEKIKELKNLRKQRLNLETVYGHEKSPREGEPSRLELMQKDSSLPFLRLDYTEAEINGFASVSFPNDLPRKDGSVDAYIADCRNDENLILAQTLVAFIKFHNAMVVALNETGKYKAEELFDKARQLTIRYYQTIILTDFLPRIVDKSILKEVLAKRQTGELFFNPKPDDMFIPLEFAVAAFRFGHSMIRKEYNLNREKEKTSLDELFMFTGRGKMNGNDARRHLPSIWIVNWYLFYDFINGSPFNIAERINTEIPADLLQLVPEAAHNFDGRADALAALDLFRGRNFGLPTGQAIAEIIYGKKGAGLSAAEIGDLIMRKEIRPEDAAPAQAQKIKERLRDVFSQETPLWFYILAEAEIQNDGKLGKVGGTIVAETFVQLLYNNSEHSILREDKWQPGEDFLLKSDKTFGMPEMLAFVQETSRTHFNVLYDGSNNDFDEINPLG